MIVKYSYDIILLMSNIYRYYIKVMMNIDIKKIYVNFCHYNKVIYNNIIAL